MNEKGWNKVSLEQVFSPRAVAVVGASASGAMSFAGMVLAALKDAGFPAIYPVNPKYDEVGGLPCYPSIRAVPGPVDHVVVNIPAEAAPALLDDCAAKGVRSVHFFTAGFGESGEAQRAALEKSMLEKARAGGFRIIGPNCVGLFVPRFKLVNVSGAPLDPGPIAFLSQSGGHAENIPTESAARGLRFSKVVSYGNALDVDEIELLEYLAGDPETEVIAAYIEGVRDGRRFLTALGDAAARKPVVVYKGGRTEAGQRAAAGHTASMTSSVAVFESLCRQLGTIQVENLDELIDVLVALRFAVPRPKAGGVAIMGAGGGPSVLASDEMEKAGLHMPPFSPEVQGELKRLLPIAGSIFGNPLDTPNMATPEAICSAVGVLAKVPEVDIIFYHLGFHPIGRWGFDRFASPSFLEPVVDAFDRVRREEGKSVILALRPSMEPGGLREFLATQQAFVKAGFPVFHSLHQGAKAMARLLEWGRQHSQGR